MSTPSTTETHDRRTPARGDRRAILLDRIAVLLFLAVLALPGIAFGIGARPENLEARRLATMPPATADGIIDAGFFAELDRFLADQFPLRAIAVRAHALIDYGLARGSPNPDVLVGEGDWLFFRGEIRPECRLDAVALLAAWDALSARATASGVELRFAITPDKHAIYPAQMGPAGRLGTPCTDASRPAVRAGIAQRPAAAVDLWGPIEDRRSAQPDFRLYWHQDSHWTPQGAEPAIRALVEADAPGTWDDADVHVVGMLDRQQELARLIGLPRTEPVPMLVVERDNELTRSVVARPSGSGEAADAAPGERVVARYRSSGPDAVVPGTTVIVHDSFFGIYVPLIAPWYEDSIWIHVTDLQANPELGTALPPFDRIIFQVTEREAYRRGYTSILAGLLGPP